MIPATQRTDGTWRKARKIRTGFNSSSGGATRYVPPAFRNITGGHGNKDGDGLVGSGRARSLGEVAAADGRGGARRFLDAALFLLTATPAPSATTVEMGIKGGKWEGSSGGSEASVSAPSSPLRSAARVAKETLGCDDCRVLSPEKPRAAAAAAAAAPPSVSASATALADGATSREQCGSDDDLCSNAIRSDREGGDRDRDTASISDEWWVRLRQAERGWASSEPDQHEGSLRPKAGETRGRASWVGLQLKLRASEVHCVDGQTAIVGFLKGRVGEQVAGVEEEEEEEGAAQKEVENDSARFPGWTHSQTIIPMEPTGSSALAMISAAAGGEEEALEGRGRLPSSSSSSVHNNNNDDNNNDDDEKGSRRAMAAMADACAGQEQGVLNVRQEGRGEATVVVAVLVFGPELSKRDRAELHGQAEEAGGVASSSHGGGGGRFLSLTCGHGSRARAVELELSPEKAEFARRLFRLAQQEYHSRYERLSHREIREVVFRGGPSAQDHADLFRLAEKHQQNQRDADGPRRKGYRSGNASADKATSGIAGAVAPAATERASPEQSGVGTASEQTNERLSAAGVVDDEAVSSSVFLLPSGGGRVGGDGGGPPSV